MPYALFSNEAKLSKAYPTEADVWKIAQKSGLVVDVVSDRRRIVGPDGEERLGVGLAVADGAAREAG